VNVKQLQTRIADTPLPDDVSAELRKRLDGSADDGTGVLRVSRALDLPWKPERRAAVRIAEVQAALTERLRLTHEAGRLVAEHLAVTESRAGGARASESESLLCVAGPPGVDRDGVAQEIATALKRPVQLVPLPQLGSPEVLLGTAESPGALMEAVEAAGSAQAVIVLQDIDQIGSDWGSDAFGFVYALTAPERRRAFSDPYFGIPFDLSNALIVVTARWTHGLPAPVRERLDIVEIEGFTDTDRVRIAEQAIVPAVMSDYHVAPNELSFAPEAVEALARAYTLEPGLENLEGLVRRLVRRVLTDRASGVEDVPDTITVELLTEYLGRPSRTLRRPLERGRPGIVGTLVVGDRGGEFGQAQAVNMPGTGRLLITGTESTNLTTKLSVVSSVVRARLSELAVSARYLEEFDTHIRVPVTVLPGEEDAVGLAAAIALVSLMRDVSTDPELAAIGRLDLLGHISPVDGVAHMMLAAHRAGVRRVVLPRGNERALDYLPPQLHDDITFIPIEDLAQALQVALR
jgi:ATP-dependent Lon protease